MAKIAHRLKVPMTFMIAQDPYLQHFIKEFTKINGGKALYAGLDVWRNDF